MTELYFPAAHNEQLADVVAAWYRPEEQLVHADALAAEYCPSAQAVYVAAAAGQ